MRYKDITCPDVCNGTGCRVILWLQGCTHHCKGCQNPETWCFNGGKEFDAKAKDKLIELLKLPYIKGLTLSGGDPLFQPEACTLIAKHAKEIGLDVWCYTGFTFEALLKNEKALDLLKYVDVLVDGPFILKEKSYNVDFRGSRNQRVIDVPKSLEEKRAIVIPKYKDERIVTNKIYRPQNVYI